MPIRRHWLVSLRNGGPQPKQGLWQIKCRLLLPFWKSVGDIQRQNSVQVTFNKHISAIQCVLGTGPVPRGDHRQGHWGQDALRAAESLAKGAEFGPSGSKRQCGSLSLQCSHSQPLCRWRSSSRFYREGNRLGDITQLAPVSKQVGSDWQWWK